MEPQRNLRTQTELRGKVEQTAKLEPEGKQLPKLKRAVVGDAAHLGECGGIFTQDVESLGAETFYDTLCGGGTDAMEDTGAQECGDVRRCRRQTALEGGYGELTAVLGMRAPDAREIIPLPGRGAGDAADGCEHTVVPFKAEDGVAVLIVCEDDRNGAAGYGVVAVVGHRKAPV